MRKSNWTDQISKATKTTVVICGVLLIVTSVVILLLMFFPMQKVDQPTVVVEPPRHTEYSATTRETTTAPETTHEGPHTLSTWNAGIDGFYRSVDEFRDTRISTTTDPRLWRETTAAPKSTTTSYDSYETTFTFEPADPGESTFATEHPQTVTTTVAPPPQEELTAPPLPVDFENAGNAE